MSLKRVLAWLLLAFVIFFVVTQPQTAAGLVRNIFGGLSDAAEALADFMQSLV